MTDRPWENEPDSLDFEAEGLPCAMWRNYHGVWCGYVGVGPEHPLFGLPGNHLLKLPPSWFEGRRMDQGLGPIDFFIHAMSGKELNDACPISLAFHVHGGVSYDGDHVPDHEPDGRWWFGFDCGHAGDYAPARAGDKSKIMNEMIDSMPEHVRDTMRGIVFRESEGVYRDQQYVVSECQSFAVQLNAIAAVITKEAVNGPADDRRH